MGGPKKGLDDASVVDLYTVVDVRGGSKFLFDFVEFGPSYCFPPRDLSIRVVA